MRLCRGSDPKRITNRVAASYASTYAAPTTTLKRITREIYGREITDVGAVGPLTMHDLPSAFAGAVSINTLLFAADKGGR